jgi:type I restriction enzyme S subunit
MAAEAQVIHTPSTAAKLPVGWSWKRLDAVCEGVFDCPHSTPVITEVGPYLARSQDMRSGVFRTDKAARVSEQTYRERIARAEPGYGDLLYSREGTYFGIAAELPAGVRVCLGQRMVMIRPNPFEVSFRFLRYWLNSPVMALHTGGHRDGSVAQRLNLPTIRALPIVVPPLPEQRAIAEILGALDDKIELNRRMSATLEAMARALFKSWFVDFDPVRAKADGRDPRLPKALSDLFPSRLVGSELGDIPEAWEVQTLGTIVELVYGKALKAGDRRDGYVPVYGSNGQVGWHDERLSRGPGIVVGRKGNPGVVTWAPVDFFVIDTAFYVLPTGACRSLHFLFHALRLHDLKSLGADSAVPGLNRNLAYMSLQLLPPQPLVQRFDAYADALTARVRACAQESRTLAALRDTLLPKLIAGELRVKDAERFVSGSPVTSNAMRA